jgi:RNA polymerase sigma factor (sigma-70 family)
VISPQQLEAIWREHVDRLVLIARSFGGPAEDAVQEAFIKLATQTNPPDDAVAWMVGVVRNQLISWHRAGLRRRKREESISQSKSWFCASEVSLETGDGLDGAIDASELTRSLQQLPDSVRQIVVMHHWGNLTFDQIATIIGKSRSTTHREYQQGIIALRKQLTVNANG